jgi:hypothetical protein
MSSKSSENIEPNSEDSKTKVELQLGDIIKISNPKNERIDNKEFFINYIDTSKMFLLNPETGEIIKLKISPDGIIGDGNITQLIILSRSESPSYAIQNGLTTNKWINIHFGGDYPAIITGEITNLENDMIEVKTIDNDTIYINFDYKGIPEDLPIEYFEIREKPYNIEKMGELGKQEKPHEEEGHEREGEEPMGKFEELEKEKIFIPAEKIQIGVQTTNIKNQLKEFILKADEIQFGFEELGTIYQMVDVEKEKKRYSIDEQVSDLLDDLLSTIPNSQRTQRVLNNIHIIIERFKQLRENFSTKDQNGNIDGVLVVTSDFKPLVNYFSKFKQNLYWIMPIVKNVKKIYDVTDDQETNSDVNFLNNQDTIVEMIDIIDNYKSNSMPLEQNKYAQLYNDLNPYFTPFDLIDDESNDILVEKYVYSNINVILDNLENMYSSIFTRNNVRNRRFVIQKYTDSLKKLNTIETTESKVKKTVTVNMTQPDLMSIKSFVTLPEPVVRFTKVSLPGTNLLEKANLNLVFFNYWQFLNKKTHVNDIFVENLNQEIDFNEDNFVNNIKKYTLNLSSDDMKGLTKEEIYKSFIQIIVPKTRVLFNLMKKYIKGKISIVDVVGYLEPFLIYTDNLTYMQYVEILNFLNEKISDYNKNIVERSRLFLILKKMKSEPIIYSNAYSILSILETKDNIREDITNEYDIMNEKEYTNSEILRKITLKDYGKLYTTALSLQSAPLMFPSEFSSLFETEQDKLNKKILLEKQGDNCKSMIVAKQYFSIKEVEEDNNKTIFFDKKYDKTNYGILDEYEKDMLRMTPEDFIIHLINELKKKQKLNDENAEYLAESLIDGHKKVLNGQYAILFLYDSDKSETEYFIRKDNTWVLDSSIEKQTNTTDTDILCDLQEKCISPGKESDNCESISVNKLVLQNQLLKDVVNEFDAKYKLSKEEFEKKIKERYDYLSSIMAVITKIETSEMLKYSIQKYNIGKKTEEDKLSTIVSPYANILNIILGQQDFVKKQYDIIRFVNTFTRPHISQGFGPLNKKESEYWLYCIKTNVELLPVFRFDMAVAFTTNPSGYNDFVDKLITRIGKESDDGDSWTALGSGWTIRKADFDIEEGYEDGFRVTTRSTLEEDAGNKIITAIQKDSKQVVKYKTLDAIMVSNIVNALSIAMGINIEPQKEFIINCVLETKERTMITEESYKIKKKEMSEKGKSVPPYKVVYNSTIMYYTLGMFLIAIQTSVPSVKTRKTHPGCVRSFNGYPFEGAGDFSSLKYLACVAFDIRDSGEPWNVLRKKDDIENKVKDAIDRNLLSIPIVKTKIDEKTDYLLLSQTDKIPEEHDISNWTQFLPPLFPFKVKNVLNIAEGFQSELLTDLRNGSPNQREKLLVLESKIIQFSLYIQEKIQNIVKKKQTLLQNSNFEPYLENACCQTKDGETTIEYFIKNDNSILEYNEIVQRLSNILSDVSSYTKSGLFSSIVNTKNKYPPLSHVFDEKTIYLAFITFCRFKSLLPVPEDLRVCAEKPDNDLLNVNDNIDETIRKLKENGRNYTNETFLRLLQLVGRNNIIPIDLDVTLVSSVVKLNNLLETIHDENDQVVEGSLITRIQNALNTFDIATPKITPAVKELNDYLFNGIKSMKTDIIDFIERNRGPDIRASHIQKIKKTIMNLSKWNIDSDKSKDIQISNEPLYNIVNFYKTFVGYFVSLFPNIILHKMEYKNLVQKYLNLSPSHASDIFKRVQNYYDDLKKFYGNDKLIKILNTIQRSSKNIERLSQERPCFSTIHYKEEKLKPVFDETTSKFLYEYYLLRVLVDYIDLSDTDEMVVNEVENEDNVQELFSVDYIEDRDNRQEFMETVQMDTPGLVSGNKKELRQIVTNLLLVFINIMDKQKDTIDISYEQIKDNIFKLKEKEKDKITDRLKSLHDSGKGDEVEIDNILKIHKLGIWNKGLQKGLTVYDKEMYEEEEEFRNDMQKAEQNIRKKNKNVTDENIEQYVEDYMEQQNIDEEIEREAFNMEYLNEDFYDGNYDGNDAPEEEAQDYADYNS